MSTDPENTSIMSSWDVQLIHILPFTRLTSLQDLHCWVYVLFGFYHFFNVSDWNSRTSRIGTVSTLAMIPACLTGAETCAVHLQTTWFRTLACFQAERIWFLRQNFLPCNCDFTVILCVFAGDTLAATHTNLTITKASTIELQAFWLLAPAPFHLLHSLHRGIGKGIPVRSLICDRCR